MEKVLYEFPGYAQEIIKRLINARWLIHSFDLENENNVYNPAEYLYNSEFNGLEYTIHLDLNIYQYVLSAFKKNKKHELHRDAIALMVFGKFTNVIFDPTLAVYEKLNYLDECPEELVEDLILFRMVDNSDMDGLAEFALGYTDNIKLPEILPINRSTLKSELTKYKRLKKWDSLYLFVLKITELHYFDKSSNEKKIDKFLNWCFSDFLYSLVALSFSIRLLGNNPLLKLMKYKPSLCFEKRKNALINMTWDLFLLDKFFETWITKEEHQEFIYASNDKPLKEVLKMAISIQIKENGNELGYYLSSSLIKKINEIDGIMDKTEGRSVNGIADFKCYRDKLIKNAELVVLS